MTGLTWTQADLDALKAAVASGVLTVRYDGPPKREITYHSLAAMRDLLADMNASLQAQAGKPTVRYATTSKGL